MGPGAYTLGLLLLGLVVASVAVSGLFVRRTLLPTWSGAPARLAEAVTAIAVLVVVAELVGSVGAFSRLPVLVAYVAVAGAARAVYVRRARVREERPAPTAVAPASGRLQLAAAVVVGALALIPWAKGTVTAYQEGMRGWDTLQYHMPFAARFVQEGSVAELYYVGNAPVTFYPMNSELVHAIGILVFQHDVLSPVLNIGWLALALLAGWCIGRPSGVGPATMAATAVAVSLPVIVGTQAGTAKNDVTALALFLAAVALSMSAPPARGALVLGALAAGLAAGTRLNLWAPVLALAVVTVASRPAGKRLGATALWAVAALAGSTFWYLRNLIEVGNPLPWFGASLGLPATTAPEDCGVTSIANYTTNPSFIDAYLVPQLPLALGPYWWLIVLVAGAGIVGGMLTRGAPVARRLAVIAAVSAIGYLLTPATAGGESARCFAFNTRFALPAIALGLILVPLVLSRFGFGPVAAVLGAMVLLVVTELSYGDTFAEVVAVSFNPGQLSFALAVVACVTAVSLLARRPLRGRVLAASVLVVVAAAGALGWRVQDAYSRDRYGKPRLTEPIEEVYALLKDVRHARIAVSGLYEIYPLYGRDLSNRVAFPATRIDARFEPHATCPAWLAALAEGDYDYVVTARRDVREAPAAEWTRRYPGVESVVAVPPAVGRTGPMWSVQLFALERGSRVDPESACADVTP